jgi:catechol 2,3-dioxygenase-like lactoylglutathione lyase family enzyme
MEQRGLCALRPILDFKSPSRIGQTSGAPRGCILRRMITGAHVLFYSTDPENGRAFFRNVLGFRAVDVGGGWLIFALPPAEAAIHPSDVDFSQKHAGQTLLGAVLYLMCDDLQSEISALEKKKVICTEVQEAEWGMSTTIPLPSGHSIGLYQPRHQTAINPNAK